MGKHAYCIIAHNDKYCLSKLLSILDDERNDIFLLLDKKVSADFATGLHANKSNLKIIEKEKRVDVRWGHISQIEAELTVLATAIENGSYDYIHLISGADLPIKSQDEIHKFFDTQPSGTLFVTINEDPAMVRNVLDKVRYYNFFTKYQRSVNPLYKLLSSIGNKAAIGFQKSLGIKRKWKDYKIGKGSQWATLTDEFVRHILDRKNFILNKFRYIKCADEIFLQSEILNSQFKDKLYRNKDGNTDHMRKMEFRGDSPRVFTMSDYEMLILSDDLFARKFSSTVDKEIIDKISSNLLPISPKR